MFVRHKKTKYKGVTYDSAIEAEIAEYLDSLLKAKKIKGWDRQYRVALPMMGQIFGPADKWTGKCTLDFSILLKNSEELLADAKGTWSMRLAQNKMAELRYRLAEVLYKRRIHILEKKTYKEKLDELIKIYG